MDPELQDDEPTRDDALQEVVTELRRLDPTGERWAAVIRHTYDVIYNGQETGRYRWDQLMKTEKTHFGTLFEIFAQREFEFDGGDTTDFRITGHQVDAKWSQSMGGWMLPPEVFDELALVATGSDHDAVWSLGIIRVTEAVRKTSRNRDQKSSLSREGLARVHWLWRDAPLPPNVLLQLDSEQVDRIFAHKFGTQRTHELFRAAEGRLVHRSIVATVSRQLDAQKRVRGNGGSRDILAKESILILSGKYHRRIAIALGVPVPRPDEYISVRVVPSDDDTGAYLGGRYWRQARDGDTAVLPAPPLHEPKDSPDER